MGTKGREEEKVYSVIQLSVNTRKMSACTLKQIFEDRGEREKRIRCELREHGKTPKGMKPMVTAH